GRSRRAGAPRRPGGGIHMSRTRDIYAPDQKRIAVIVRCMAVDRVAEALRAAIGLSLRGDAVTAVMMDDTKTAVAAGDPRIRRALATLETLGHSVAHGNAHVPAAVRHADAVEVW